MKINLYTLDGRFLTSAKSGFFSIENGFIKVYKGNPRELIGWYSKEDVRYEICDVEE